MKQLIEDYKRRLASVTEMLENFKSTGSENDIKKGARLNARANEYRSLIADLEKLGAPEFIKKIDFTLLRTQKTSLLGAIEYFEKNKVPQLPDDLQGILALIDALQDYAVDEMGWPEMQVFDLDAEEEREANEKPQPRKVWSCAKCGGDHVEEKRWVDLNTEEVKNDDGTKDYWCADCGELTNVYVADIKAGAKVIGFQVVGSPYGNEEMGDLHPDIPDGDVVFTLERARKMIQDSNIPSDWQLLAVWTGDIENPIFWQD